MTKFNYTNGFSKLTNKQLHKLFSNESMHGDQFFKENKRLFKDINKENNLKFDVMEIGDPLYKKFAFSILENKAVDHGKTVVTIGLNPHGTDTDLRLIGKLPSLEPTRQTAIVRSIATLDELGEKLQRLVQLDLFAIRTNDASDLKKLAGKNTNPVDLVGEYNPSVIKYWLEQADFVIPAWGSSTPEIVLNPSLCEYYKFILNLIGNHKKNEIYLFGLNGNLTPTHSAQYKSKDPLVLAANVH